MHRCSGVLSLGLIVYKSRWYLMSFASYTESDFGEKENYVMASSSPSEEDEFSGEAMNSVRVIVAGAKFMRS